MSSFDKFIITVAQSTVNWTTTIFFPFFFFRNNNIIVITHRQWLCKFLVHLFYWWWRWNILWPIWIIQLWLMTINTYLCTRGGGIICTMVLAFGRDQTVSFFPLLLRLIFVLNFKRHYSATLICDSISDLISERTIQRWIRKTLL